MIYVTINMLTIKGKNPTCYNIYQTRRQHAKWNNPDTGRQIYIKSLISSI